MATSPNLDPNRRPREAHGLVFPLILIVIGGLFLYANWRPGFDAWRVLVTYWPLILIFLGLGKIWDNTRQGGPARGYSSGLSIGVLAFVAVIAVLLWHGRSFSRAAGYSSSSAMRSTSKSVDLGGATSVHADIDMPAGELTIGGGSDKLVDAKFEQQENAGQPRVQYSLDDGKGELKVWTEDSGPHIGRHDSTWDLRFGSNAPLELKINMGAGQGNLRLRGLPVTRLDLSLGAGRVVADLTGERKQDLTADLEGGVGEAEIRLPKDVGVIVEASGGIGSVNTHGLRKEGGHYVNDAYGKTAATIHLRVQGGIGNINLTEE